MNNEAETRTETNAETDAEKQTETAAVTKTEPKTKTKKRRLAVQFTWIFAILSALMLVISAIVSYVNQTDAYHHECVKNLQTLTNHLAALARKEDQEFINLKKYFSEHPDRVQIPLDFRGDYRRARRAFFDYFFKTYPGEMFDKTMFYDDLDDTAKELYVTWRFEHWFITFFDSVDEFGLSYVYFIYPDESKDHTMIYMFDPTMGTRITEDGREILDLGEAVFEDPQIHKYMWQAWERGTPQNGFDDLNNEFGHVYTYCMPLVIGDEKVGLVCAEISVESVNDAILKSVWMDFAATTLILMLTLFVLYRFMQNRILDRVARLEKDVVKYSEDKDPAIIEDIRDHKGRNDELGSLSDEFGDMIGELEDYMKNLQAVTAEKERIGAELGVATKIQSSMLPRIFPPFPDRTDMDLFASMTPAKEVGGDFYDFFLLDDDHIALVMADVSGKGVPAALFMVIAKTLIKNHLQAGESVEKALSAVNDQLSENNDEMLFVTAWVCVIDLKTGHVEFSDAGHETAYVLHADGTVTEIKPAKKRPPLAAVEGIEYLKDEFTLAVGDRLFLYTDGVPEATNAQDELYGAERLSAFLAGHTGDSSEELLGHVHDNVNQFVAEAPQFDDLTMLAFARVTAEKS